MILKVVQKQFTFFADKYKIYDNEDVIGTAKSSLITLGKKITFSDNSGYEIFNIYKHVASIYPSYEISFSENNYVLMQGQSLISGFYIIRVPDGVLEIHDQNGLSRAIFLNDSQIAVIRKKEVTFNAGDQYVIKANSDANKQLLIAICLAWEISKTSNSGTKSLFSVNADLGNVGPVIRLADENWEPTK